MFFYNILWAFVLVKSHTTAYPIPIYKQKKLKTSFHFYTHIVIQQLFNENFADDKFIIAHLQNDNLSDCKSDYVCEEMRHDI